MNKNKIGDNIRQLFHRTASLTIIGFVSKAIKERREKLANDKKEDENEVGGRKDLLTRFLEIQNGNPNIPLW